MKLSCSIGGLIRNRDFIKDICNSKNLELAFMIKKQLAIPEIMSVLDNEKVYTTEESSKAKSIYHDKNIVIVDAFERREGISVTDAVKIASSELTAIVNFYCCEERIPTDTDLNRIYKKLKSSGFGRVSFGGSMFIEFDYTEYDEMRVGEAFLTGYSTVYNKEISECNPFSVELDIYKEEADRYVVEHGFLEIGGFTDADTVCVNTDFTVIEKRSGMVERNGKLILHPDYFTLIKLAHNGDLKNAEFTR